VRGATEGINLVAQSWGRRYLEPGDEILVTHLEHHANIVPWQMLCEQQGARLKYIPVDKHGDLVLDQLDELLTPRTRILAVTHVSNALGTVNPVRDIIRRAHARGVPVLVDGAQALQHFRVDVQELDCDFYAFSGHKMFGPTGIGVLYGKASVLEPLLIPLPSNPDQGLALSSALLVGLIEEGCKILAVVFLAAYDPDSTESHQRYEKVLNNIKEVKSRDGIIVSVGNANDIDLMEVV